MRRSTSGIIMAVGLVAIVAVAWLYLQDRQQAASSPTASSAATGQSGSTAGPLSSAAGPAEPSEPGYVAQDAGEGGVKISAAVLAPGAIEQDPTLSEMASKLDPESEIGIMVIFETHAGDLSNLDLVALSSLSAPDGDHPTVRWVTESDSEHHRSGMLVFERGGLDLAAVDGDLTLTVRDVAGVPTRTLTWLLPLG
ncbi:MAG: hypothetical protein ACYC33_01015 [Thermoleophilia bacterium]